MFSMLRSAYGAGYRAGRSGTHYGENPFNNFVLRHLWAEGWYKGAMQRADEWLTKHNKGE